MITTKCPICGRRHQFRHSAWECFQDTLMGMDVKKDKKRMKKLLKDYYLKLPVHPRYKGREKR